MPERFRTIAVAPPLGFLALLFGAQLAALWRYRLDYPAVDDWRYYQPGFAMPTAFSPDWLFAPSMDTLHVTGKLLDWSIFRFVAHDYQVLAVLSFALAFGGWLICGAAVVLLAARSDRATLLACLAVFCLPLAGAPYWVTVSPEQWLEPAVAYHQMLPVLGLAALSWFWLTRPRSVRGERRTDWIVALALTTTFSLAYTSGALALFVFGGSLLGLSALAPRKEALRTPVAIAICIGATACLAIHVLGPLQSFDFNPVTEARGPHELTSPTDPVFWRFFFALFDRAILSTASGGASQLRGGAVFAIVAATSAGLSTLLLRGKLEGRRRRAAEVIAAGSFAVLAYAFVVSFGRASFGGFYFAEKHGADAQAVLYAKSRFFFWWITALLPLSLSGAAILLEQLVSPRASRDIVLMLAVLVLWPKPMDPAAPSYLRQWSYWELYADDARELRDLAERDFDRTRGGTRIAASTRTWLDLPPEMRNPAYSRHGAWEQFALRKLQYQRARNVGATFVERWELLPGDDEASPEIPRSD